MIETGVAFRVGLGKEIVKGPLRVGLSVTVFATLEGGYGTLYRSDARDLGNGPGQPNHMHLPVQTKVAHTYIRIRGTVGVLGELYGYVDFGIVKAGVTVRVWVAIGIDLQTDHRTKLFIQAGVSVAVEVVIAEFSVFGHHVKISIHFSFATTIEYVTYVGSDGPLNFYQVAPTSEVALLVEVPPNPAPIVPTAVNWTTALVPEEWRAAGVAGLVNLPLYLSADFTMAKGSDGAVAPEAVLLLLNPDRDAEGQATPIGDLAAALAGWALKATLGAGFAGTPLRDWSLNDETIDRVSAFIAGDGVVDDPAQRRLRLPLRADLETFLAANLHAAITPAPAGDGQAHGVLFPLPPNLHLKRTGFTSDPEFDDVDLDSKAFVDDAYRDRVDQQFADLIRLEGAERRGAEAASAPESLISTLFEEHLGLVIRAAVAKLAALARDTDTTNVGDLLDLLAKVDTAQPESSPGFEIFGTASRLFAHGPRLPLPADTTQIPSTVPHDNGVHGLYRLSWLQVPLRNMGPGDGELEVTASAGWLAATAAFALPVHTAELAGAIAAYQALQGKLGGTVTTDHLYREVTKEYAARPAISLGDHSLVRFPPELVRALADVSSEGRSPQLATRPSATKPSDIQVSPDAVPGAEPVIAATVFVRPVVDPTTVTADGQAVYLNDIVEIVTINENERVCLDWFENGENGGSITSLNLFSAALDAAGNATSYGAIAGAGSAVVVQTNLSTEIRPGQLPESELLEETRSVAETFVASLQGDAVAFVDIVRRAAIVNTGGTFVRCAGIAAGKSSQFELLLVVDLDPTAARRGNAFINPGAPNPDGPVLVITTGETGVEPLADAGSWPVLVTRDDSNLSHKLEIGLSARFSMLAYEVLDETGAPLGGRDISHSLSIGPTKTDDDKTAADADTIHRYRVSLPLAGLAQVGPYDVVGRTIQVRTGWRDIYGNAWPDDGDQLSDKIVLGYVDRLIPLSDLPSTVFGWWPGATSGALKVLIAFDTARLDTLVPANVADGAQLAADQTAAILDGAKRAAVLYGRVSQQLADERVSATVTSRLWQQQQQSLSSSQKQALVGFVTTGAKLYEDLYQTLAAAAAAVETAGQWRARVSAVVAADLGAAADLHVMLDFIGALSADTFIELTLDLGIARPFDLVGQRQGWTQEQLSSLWQSGVSVGLPFRDSDPNKQAPRWVMPLGAKTATIADLADAFRTAAPDLQCATGYSGTPGLVDRAIWLVRNNVLPEADAYKGVQRVDLAVPPVSTRLHSGGMDIDVFVPGAAAGTKPFIFRDVDADSYAREALRRIDAALAPAVLKGVAASATSDDLHGILRAKSGIAEHFSTTALPVFEDATVGTELENSVQKLLNNRFRRKLDLIYDIDTVVAYGDPQTAHPGEAVDAGPQAYGTIDGSADPIEAATVSFEPFNMPLTTDAKHLFVACDAAPSDHAADSSGGTVPAPRTFKVTHVQRASSMDGLRGSIGDPGRYRPTAWLKLVAPLSLALNDHEQVPVTIRRMPRKPAMLREAFGQVTIPDTGTVAKRLETARQWTTDRDWTYEAKNVDKLRVTLRFNGPDDTTSAAPESSPSQDIDSQKTQAFVRFVAATEGLLATLQGGDAGLATEALAFFRRQAEMLNAALSQLARPESELQEELLRFDVSESATGDQRQLVVEPVDPMPAPLSFAVTILSIASRPSWSGDVDRRFNEPANLVDRSRRLTVAGLDVLGRHRSVRSELDLTRNATINGKDVAKPFVYVVPTIASGNMTRPLLDQTDAVRLDDQTDTLAQHFANLFDGLQPAGDPAANNFVADIFVTFEPWISADDNSTGEGTFVAAWRGASLATTEQTNPAFVRDALVKATGDWLSAHKPQRAPSGVVDSRLVIDVRIYDGLQNGGESATGTGQCVLRLRRCTIALGSIS